MKAMRHGVKISKNVMAWHKRGGIARGVIA